MLAEISAGLSSLKTMKDIVQGMNAAKGEAAVNSVKIELQGLILEAQQGLFAAQEAQSASARRITQLEQEIVGLKDWSAEKERYELKNTGQGAFAYAPKDSVECGKAAPYLCADCFERGHKSFLQPEDRMPGRDEFLVCNHCKSELIVRGARRPEHSKRGR